jgi:hypothetical protein
MTVSDLLEQLYYKSSEVYQCRQACYKLLTACSKLVTTTGNKQCEQNLLTACEQTCNNLFADLSQYVRFYVCSLIRELSIFCTDGVSSETVFS